MIVHDYDVVDVARGDLFADAAQGPRSEIGRHEDDHLLALPPPRRDGLGHFARLFSGKPDAVEPDDAWVGANPHVAIDVTIPLFFAAPPRSGSRIDSLDVRKQRDGMSPRERIPTIIHTNSDEGLLV